MSAWGKKKFVDVVAETKDKEVTTRPPPVAKSTPSPDPKEAITTSKDDKEKSVNGEEKSTGNYKKKSPENVKSSSNGKSGKRDAALNVQEQDKNISNIKEEPIVVPEKKEMIFGTVKGAGAWGNNLLVDKIKEKTAEEEAAAAAAAANRKKSRMREKTDIVKESPDAEKIEEGQVEIRVAEMNDATPAHIVEVDCEVKERKDDIEVHPVAELSPKSKEGKKGRRAAHKDEGPTELVPIEDSIIAPIHHDPQPEAEQPAVAFSPVVTFPEDVSLPTNVQYRFEGFLYSPKKDEPAVPRSPAATPLGMSASPAPMAMSPGTGHAPTTSSREYTSFQQPIYNMKSNVALPHQRFNNYGPSAANWNGNVTNHMGNRYTSEYNGHQQRTGFAGAPQNHQQQQFNRNYNMPLPHGQPMRSSHHQQQVGYPNASQSSYANNGYNRPIRRNNSGMVNIPRPNAAGQVRPQGQGSYAPFYAPRGQYHSQPYRGTGATFYQPHHHNQYNTNNNSGANYINQQPNMGRGGTTGNLPAYTQQ
eukprot:Tbor_TRINITY_DN3669_c0_g1::TRINITY_DN3669_c0_g1_i1::g.284::m.284